MNEIKLNKRTPEEVAVYFTELIMNHYIEKRKVKEAIDNAFLEDKYLPDNLRNKNVFVKKKQQILKELNLSNER